MRLRRVRRTPTAVKSKPKSAGGNIVRGLAGIASQFIPGVGPLAKGLTQFFGSGAYTAGQAEQILATTNPSMNSTLDVGTRISHHEYLGDVSSTVLFSVSTFAINPGMSTTFPWLSTLASSFQEYEINGLVFYFKSTSANALNSTNTALGQIIGATQYNPYATAPANKIEMLALSAAADGKPSESNIYPVECKTGMVLYKNKLIRSGGVTDDLAKYDHGNFFLATNGMQAAATIGELHVVYDITLKKPKLITAPSLSSWYAHATSTGYTNSQPLGTVFATYLFNNLGISLPTADTIRIPGTAAVAGTRYRARFVWTGTAAAYTAPTVSYTNAAAVASAYTTGGSTARLGTPTDGTTSAACMMECTFLVATTGVAVDITLSGAALPTGTNRVDFVVTEMGES